MKDKFFFKTARLILLTVGAVCLLMFTGFSLTTEAQRANLMYTLNGARQQVVWQEGNYNSFTAQTGTGATTALAAPMSVMTHHSIQLVVTGAPSTCTYRLQGSNDNTNWFNISASDITCTSSTQAYETSKPARWVRGNLLTLTGGTSPTITLHYASQ